MKQFTAVIIATDSKQVTSVRFTDNVVQRHKKLKVKKFTDIYTYWLPTKMCKADALRYVLECQSFEITDSNRNLLRKTLRKYSIEKLSVDDILDAIRERNGIVVKTTQSV